MIAPELQKALEAPLPKDAVRNRAQGGKTLSYVEGWYVIAELNRVFGHDGWDFVVRSLECAGRSERSGKGDEANLVEVWRAHCLLTVRDRDGHMLATREDIGVGLCDGPARSYAINLEKALKEAPTDGLKRCARTLGHRFGLALYDKTQEHVGGSAEALRLLDELETVAWRELDAWAKRNAEALKSLDETDRAAVRMAFKGRRDNPPTALQQLGDDLESIDTREGLRMVWQEHARAIQAMCEPPDDSPLRAAREACWARAQACGLASTRGELAAILSGQEPPPRGGKRAPAPANDAPSDVDPERAAIQGEAAADGVPAGRAWIQRAAGFRVVERALASWAAHRGEFGPEYDRVEAWLDAWLDARGVGEGERALRKTEAIRRHAGVIQRAAEKRRAAARAAIYPTARVA